MIGLALAALLAVPPAIQPIPTIAQTEQGESPERGENRRDFDFVKNS